MTTDVPIWLLDVDGVLNAFDETVPVLGDWDDWETFTAREFPIRYSPTMCRRIRELHDAGAVEVRWLTTWGRHANTDLAARLGFPEFEVAGEQLLTDRGCEWWKLPIAQRLFEEGHAIIWTDDDITYSSSAVDWLRDVRASPRARDLRAYAPPGAITRQTMADIERWLSERRTPCDDPEFHPAHCKCPPLWTPAP